MGVSLPAYEVERKQAWRPAKLARARGKALRHSSRKWAGGSRREVRRDSEVSAEAHHLASCVSARPQSSLPRRRYCEPHHPRRSWCRISPRRSEGGGVAHSTPGQAYHPEGIVIGTTKTDRALA